MQTKNSFVKNRISKKNKRIKNNLEFGAIIKNEEKNYSKTGGWSKIKPRLDIGSCIKCGICSRNCPEGAIEVKKINPPAGGKKIVINYLYCKGCGICQSVCPKKAIKMK